MKTHSRTSLLAVLLTCAAIAPACSGGGDDGEPVPSGTPTPTPGQPKTTFGGDRPAEIEVPPGYDPLVPAPLLIVLHGYGVQAPLQLAYMGLGTLPESDGVFVIAPQGMTDPDNRPFWNATNACCNFYGSTVDDVAYLRDLIAEIRVEFNIDPARIHLVGHSNGGFMAHRMACDEPDLIASFVALAGTNWADETLCEPAEPVSVLQIHGTNDETIGYNGGSNGLNRDYPGAVESTTDWAVDDGCTTNFTADPTPIDLDTSIVGAETTIQRADGCPAGIGVELWTIPGGGHIPGFDDAFADLTWAWLGAHPKP